MHFLEINEVIQSSHAGIYFSTQLLLKILVYELNNSFAFHQICDVDKKSKHEILRHIYDFLTSGNKIRSFVYTQ